MKTMRWIPMVATLLVVGCQTWGPTWSEVTGNQWSTVAMNRTAAVISTVDGKSRGPEPASSIAGEPHQNPVPGSLRGDSFDDSGDRPPTT